MKRLLLNIVGFKTAWLACAFGAPVNGWLPVGIIAILISIHLTVAERWLAEVRLILLVGIIGAVVDSTLGLAGVMSFAVGDSYSHFAPPWLIALWMSFATVLPYGLRWLASRPVVAILLGAVAGPASYYGGSKTGAIMIDGSLTLFVVAVGTAWAIVMPLISWLSKQDFFNAHELSPATTEPKAAV